MESDGKLPVWRTVVESYRFLLTHPGDLARVGWLPLLALFGLNLLFGTYESPETLEPAAIAPALGLIAVNVLGQSLIAAMILVAWHRVVVFGSNERHGIFAVRFGLRELRYLFAWLMLSIGFLVLFALAFALILTAAFALMTAAQFGVIVFDATDTVRLGAADQFVFLEYLGILLAALVAVYFAIRFSLILPALATDVQRSLGRAWSLSAGNGWRLVLASLIVMLPAQAASAGIALVARELLGTGFYYPLALAASLALLLLILATGTVLSLFSIELDRGGPSAMPHLDAAAAPAE